MVMDINIVYNPIMDKGIITSNISAIDFLLMNIHQLKIMGLAIVV
jgi:hypothetical protein